MDLFGKNPIKQDYKGMPCMIGDIVGRILGEDDKSSSIKVDDKKLFSILLFSTPHGTIIKAGRFLFSKITKEGMEKLLEFEKDCLENRPENFYSGKLTKEEINALN